MLRANSGTGRHGAGNKPLGCDQDRIAAFGGVESSMTDEREEGLDKRLSDLGERLAEQKKTVSDDAAGSKGADKSAYSQAIKISSEFVAGIIAGALVGYLVDKLAGTSPWGMIFFLLLGFCAAVLNVMRALGVVATPKPEKRNDR
jgi:ATP synthase protein I